MKLKPNFKLFTTLLISGFYFLVTSAAAQGVIGGIANPLKGSYATGNQGQGLFVFLSNVFKLAGTIAGIYMVIQLIMAGFMYISASGDAKKTEQAWNQIWQSIMGMVIIASAFAIAALVERFTTIKILNPVIYGP